MRITTTTVAMLGAVVAAVAGAALAPAVLPPAHAAAGEPGTEAFVFGSFGDDPGEVRSVWDVAVDPRGRIAVADFNGDRIAVFHSNGTFAFKITIDNPRAVAFGPDGDIVVSDYHHAVRVLHPNGSNKHILWPSSRAWDVAVGPDGRFVVGTRDGLIRTFHPNGTFDFTVGKLGTDAGEFGRYGVHAVDVDRNGFIAAVDHGSNRVWVFHPNGTFLGKLVKDSYHVSDIAFGPSGEAALSVGNMIRVFHPNGTSALNVSMSGLFKHVAVGPTGLLVVGYPSDHRIHGFNGLGPADEWQPSWVFQPPPATSMLGAGLPYVPPAPAPSLTAIVPAFEFGSYGEGPGEFLAPHNIAFGPGGIIAVSDAENNRVQLFHPNGTFALEVGSRGSALGEFAGPHGLTFGPNGLLAVSDVGNHRVQVFRIQ